MTYEADVLGQIVTNVNADDPNRLQRPSDGPATSSNAFQGPPAPAKKSGAASTKVKGEAVFVTIQGGPPNEPYIDGDGDGNGVDELNAYLEEVELLVTVRSSPSKYATGYALALAVFGAIDRKPPTDYIDARATSSAPRYVQEDEINQYYWEFTVRVSRTVNLVVP